MTAWRAAWPSSLRRRSCRSCRCRGPPPEQESAREQVALRRLGGQARRTASRECITCTWTGKLAHEAGQPIGIGTSSAHDDKPAQRPGRVHTRAGKAGSRGGRPLRERDGDACRRRCWLYDANPAALGTGRLACIVPSDVRLLVKLLDPAPARGRRDLEVAPACPHGADASDVASGR